jgi:hypothetical protein
VCVTNLILFDNLDEIKILNVRDFNVSLSYSEFLFHHIPSTCRWKEITVPDCILYKVNFGKDCVT